MSKRYRWVALAFLGLALAAFQCNLSIGGGPQPTATTAAPTVAPSPTPLPPTPTPPPPTPTPELPTFREDFSDNRNGWFEFGPDDVGNAIFVQGGAYHIISVFEEDIDNFIWGGTEVQEFSDFDLTVEATQVSGTDNNEIAVVFGALGSSDFFEFAYSGDGYVALFQYVDGAFQAIREFDPSDAIVLGNATNEVRLVVENGTLTAYINGQQVMVNDVPGYSGGWIGFGCGPFEPPEAHCTFDNLEIVDLGGTVAQPTPDPEVTFEEDFSDNSNAWYEYGPDEAGTEVFVGNGVYNIYLVRQPNVEFWFGATNAWDLVNFALEAQVTFVSGTENNELAVVFGGVDNENYFEFGYSSPGEFMLGQTVNGEFQFLQEWTPTDVINLGEATNQVGLWMQDGVLTAFINDEQVLEVEVVDYTGGWIGFGCGAFEDPDAYCTFDNLVIAELG